MKPSVAAALNWTISDLTATTDPGATRGEWFQDLAMGGRVWVRVLPSEPGGNPYRTKVFACSPRLCSSVLICGELRSSVA